MAVKGIKLVTLGLIGDDGKLLTGTNGLSATGTYPVTTEVLGTKTANISNLSGSPVPIYGNNTQVDADIPNGTPSVQLDFNGLPLAIKQKILGGVNDGKGGYIQGTAPKVAMLIQTTSIGNGGADQYVAFAKGVMNEAAMNLQTSTNNVTRVDDSPTFTAFGVTRWNDKAVKFFDGADAKFDASAMMADVFPTATPSGGSGS